MCSGALFCCLANSSNGLLPAFNTSIYVYIYIFLPKGATNRRTNSYSTLNMEDSSKFVPLKKQGSLCQDPVEILHDHHLNDEGFQSLTRARSEARDVSRALSYISSKDIGNHEDVVKKHDPWHKIEKNVSFIRGDQGIPTRYAAILVVDPFSSGALLAQRVVREGFHCVRVLSQEECPIMDWVVEGLHVDYSATLRMGGNTISEEEALKKLAAEVEDLPWEVKAVMAGAESGVELTDQLSHILGLASNGIELSAARRDKYLMGERVGACGVNAVKQKLVNSEEDVACFVKSVEERGGEFKAVVKPLGSAGSDDVYLASTPGQVFQAFSTINGKENNLGVLNTGALCQEFLDGIEYVIDSVSLGGVHKVVALWEYDKRPVNDSHFVYYGMHLISADGEVAQELVSYSVQVLNAMGVIIGPSHMEVKFTSRGPCLVEVGLRCHGGEGTWQTIAKQGFGYDQINSTYDAYMQPNEWHQLPSSPNHIMKHGAEVFLVVQESGMLRGLPGCEKIKQVESFQSMNILVKKHAFVPRTVDCFTRPGSVQLAHFDPEVVKRDYEFIRKLEDSGLLDFEIICPFPLSVGAVVIVDPFSSGAIMASQVLQMGLRLVIVLSEVDSPITNMVQQGSAVRPDFTIQHDSFHPDPNVALEDTLAALRSLEFPILAILPGTEPGVELADALSCGYGSRTNGLELSHMRRNKYLMGERVRSCGVRAGIQELVKSVDALDNFVSDIEKNAGDLKVVVKPLESAGSDGVHLCSSRAELSNAFESINGQVNGLGGVNDGALCMEFLDGMEFVIDSVSRDGVHKITAIWEYDKRTANGADFIYFGMRLRTGEGEREKKLIEYAYTVLDALGISNGPGHMEVKLTSTGPCLIEVGSRCHGGEGTWQSVVQECTGAKRDQISLTLDSYLRPSVFDEAPDVINNLRKHGCEVFLVAHQHAKVF